jgi:nitrite reductase (NADH) small subunit
MAEFRTAKISALRPGRGLKVQCGGQEIALFLIEDRVVAVSNYCPHQHFPKLHESPLDGTVITCPMHGWSYDLATGKAVTGSGVLRIFPARVVNGVVFVDVNDDAD